MSRLQAGSWAIAALATVCAFFLTSAVGFRITTATFLPILAIFLLLIGIEAFYTIFRPVPLFSAVTGGVAVTSWSLLMVGVIALAGLGFHAPLIDKSLIAVDAAAGLDAARFINWIAQFPAFGTVLMSFYMSSVPLIFLTLVFLALTARNERLWGFCLTVIGSALLCALVSTVMPAIGAFSALEIPGATLKGLPAGAGTYYLGAFQAYRSGLLQMIDVSRPDGVITFPSFHIIMALATAWAYRGIRVWSGVACGVNAVVLISIVPMGGHYFVDLLAGSLIWAAFQLIAHLIAPDRSEAAASLTLTPGCAALPAR